MGRVSGGSGRVAVLAVDPAKAQEQKRRPCLRLDCRCGVGVARRDLELLTLFAAYTGLRSEELAGLEIADVVFAPVPASEPLRASVNVRRARKRRGGVWVADTLKSKRSDARCRYRLGWRSGWPTTWRSTRAPTNRPRLCGRTGHSAARGDVVAGL